MITEFGHWAVFMGSPETQYLCNRYQSCKIIGNDFKDLKISVPCLMKTVIKMEICIEEA